ncbi:hypothetical protein EV191_11434 [Tamaricihabitans halophyticus]|uniref:Chromosome segregation ATPase n=1 Tax=Tamaricihabitans halophyticus TaxID=1262583 RepID=A0A4R2QBH0_9PSEU|nr:hypothetical protein [Tamaricihabitans halophyticus]TCP46237.1 hypothetical protein EV191_11434 [Tamaricihabitans halophyticus]
MYELSRVRLYAVGPSGARYQDVLLDLSGAGPYVAAPSQDVLFAAGIHESMTRVPRRPAPASVLFLENGGGKSVLIKLIFSVMLPGRRQVVGTTNTRVLEKFVGGKDVSHVVLEWQHTRTGQRLITGKVSEWRGHTVSNDPANLIDTWYCFRPSGNVELTGLPFVEARPLTMTRFLERLDEAHRAEPELELFRTRRHSEWTDRLDAVGLDTELFRYQRAMNAGEGEAADAFAFNTDEAFVEFLLRAVLSDEQPRDLADVVASYATNLAQRGDLINERDFVAGALELLDPLAEEERLAVASRKLAGTARDEMSEFAGSVAARHRAEQDRLRDLEEHVEEARVSERMAEGDHRRVQGALTELKRIVATMQHEQAVAGRDATAEELTEARTNAQAWRETETVLAQLDAASKAHETRELVNQREEKAKPALAAKTAAAEKFARSLLGLATDARDLAEAADGRVAEHRDAAEAAQTERDAATGIAANERATAAHCTRQIEQVRAELSDAVRAGHLTDPDGVRSTAEEASAERDARTAELTAKDAELARIETKHGETQTALYEAQQHATAARATRDQAADALSAAHRRADSLAAEPRLVELLGTEQVTLETDTPALLTRLRDARAEAERAQTELRIEESRDERALAALGEGGLLPPPHEVQQGVEVLEKVGITAWSGWRYLSTLDAKRREVALRAFPHLVDGIVLNDGSQVDRAEKALAEAKLLPGALLAVGTTAAMHDGAADTAPGLDFLVPPNPAMYDEDAADAEREAIGAQQTRRQHQLRELSERISADSALDWKLTAWREDFPPGKVAELAEAAETTASAATEADDAATKMAAELERITTSRDSLRERVPELRQVVRAAEERARLLADLADKSAKLAEWTTQAQQANEAAELADERANTAANGATRAREQMAEEQRAADEHRRTAHGARAELAEVPGGGSVSPDEPVPSEPVDALRRAFVAAAEAYAKVEVGGDLRAELEQAEAAESRTRVAVDGLDEDVRELAGKLLETPDGSDSAARAAALDRARRKVAALEEQHTEAVSLVATRKAELDQLSGQAGSLGSYPRPRDVEHGRELIAEVGEEAHNAARKWDDAQQVHARAQRSTETAKNTSAGFGFLVTSMGSLVPAEATERVFDGDLDAAQAKHSSLDAALNTAVRAVEQAEARVRAAADALAQYATDKRFEKLTSPVRQQVISVRRDELPGHATEWIAALRPRLRTLTDDLEQIDRHRTGIITRLQGMVDGALRTLRSAQRLSRLPDGLGEWSGQEFLRIRFSELEDNVLAERLGEVVDEAAAGKTSDGREVKRDGISLLLRGVRAAAPKGFRVDMLKPDSVLRTERQRVSEIRDVFSGGQQLTAAIILYCTLAALRANDRGRMRNLHSGVLFLDNPIGRASAGYLLELQRAVADALGVQLIYTTGLFDAGALAEFPLIVRLRNDADLRAGRKYLSVDELIRNQLPDEHGRPELSASRIFERQRDEDDETTAVPAEAP